MRNSPEITLRALFLTTCLLAAAALPLRAAFVIDSLDGDITQNEINNFITTINSMTPPVNNYGNDMSTHGTETSGMIRMYEATGNINILNRLIVFCDVALVHRNDEPLGEGRPMWTGRVEPIWPQSSTTDQSGCESAHVAGKIAWCAKLILQTPSIWNNTVPDGNPYGYGATYRQRALTYLAKVDETLGEYFTPWFVNPTTFRIRKPTDPRWVNAAETAWNRQALTMVGYQQAAECHEILGDNPTLLQFYKNVVNAFAMWFTATFPNGGAVHYTSGGRNVVKWYYEIPNDQHIENMGHAQHDVAGLFHVWESGYTGVTWNQIKVYADTTQFIINKGATNQWANNVDGTGSILSSCKTDFIFLAQWNRPLYKLIAQSNVSANTLNGSEGCKNTAYILWMKRWVFQQSAPNFALSASPDSRNVVAGSSATYTVTITSSNGFNGSVGLTASGLPAGATASFSPASVTGSGTSTLTVTTPGSTPGAASTLTITGTSGSLTRSDTVTLNITDFTVTATPDSQTVNAGSSTTCNVAVGNINGFSGTVTLSASGLPAGASASFNPATVNSVGSSTMTVTTSASTPAGTSTVTVAGTSGSRARTDTVSLTVNSAGGPLPTGWTAQDIGAVGIAGSASHNSGTFTINASGADIWSTADEFHYAHRSVSGNVTVTARVATQEPTHAWAKSGVMIRESTAAGSAHAAVYVSASNGVSMQIRPGTGASSINLLTVAGPKAPYWVRLVRSGNTFTGFRSTDGVTWVQVASTNLTMASSARAGLAVSSHNDATLATTTFDNVSVTTGTTSCITVPPTGVWTNSAMPTQTGTFTATFDVTPSISPMSSAVGLSQGPQTAFTGFACAVVFTTAGTIQARNGGTYMADNVISSSPGVTYRFRLVVNIAARTYSIFVTPAGGSELAVGANYAFRTEQNTVTSLNSWGAMVNASPGGTMTVCGFTP